MLVVSFVMINLFIGVIIDGFNESNESKLVAKVNDFTTFAEHWGKFDPEGTLQMPESSLFQFLSTLAPPLGYEGTFVPDREIYHTIGKMSLHLYEGDVVLFKDVLIGTCRAAIENHAKYKGIDANLELPNKTIRHLAKSLKKSQEILTYFTSHDEEIKLKYNIRGKIKNTRHLWALTVVRRTVFRYCVMYELRKFHRLKNIARTESMEQMIQHHHQHTHMEADHQEHQLRRLSASKRQYSFMGRSLRNLDPRGTLSSYHSFGFGRGTTLALHQGPGGEVGPTRSKHEDQPDEKDCDLLEDENDLENALDCTIRKKSVTQSTKFESKGLATTFNPAELHLFLKPPTKDTSTHVSRRSRPKHGLRALLKDLADHHTGGSTYDDRYVPSPSTHEDSETINIEIHRQSTQKPKEKTKPAYFNKKITPIPTSEDTEKEFDLNI